MLWIVSVIGLQHLVDVDLRGPERLSYGKYPDSSVVALRAAREE